MTKKVFWSDPYRTSLSTRVTKVDENRIFLDSTVFFAFSGGQESDRGTIGGFEVVRAEARGAEIAYTLPANHGLGAGDSVEVRIDWDRRYRLMRLHFAAELVLETVYRIFPGIVKAGAHIGENKARLDFLMTESITPHLPRIAGKAARLIEEDHPIRSAFEDEERERRYWEIEGYARVPCGGTHLRRTGEIGPVELKRNNIGKGKERIEITLAS